jgi:outer membrane protein TolC
MQLKKTKRLARESLPLVLLCAMALLGEYEALAQAATRIPVPETLSLSQAIDLALKHNRSIQLAQLEVVDSQHKKEIARSAYFPHIKNESSLLHVTELAGVEIPAGAFGVPVATGPIPAKSLFIGQGSATTYTSGTGLTQPLSQMFRIRQSNRAAIADIDTAKIQVSQTEDEIALKVRELYYGLLIGQLRLKAATEEVDASNVKMQESADAVAQGRALEVTSLESHAALLEAKQTVLSQSLQIHDLVLAFDDLLGLPLSARAPLEDQDSAASVAVLSREECLRVAQELSPGVRAAEQAVIKARAGLAAAKDAYIPDITGLARYSYQSGVPLLVHNFGTFGLTLSYDLFDGGRRNAEIKQSQTLLSEAQLNLSKAKDDVNVQVEAAYDKIEQLQSMVEVAKDALGVRIEAARLAESQLQQGAALSSARDEAHAKVASAKASFLEATLGLSLAQAELKRTIGQIPR